MNPTPIHDTFTIERQFKANRSRAFAAWSQVDLKAKWFVGPAGKWSLVKREMDFVPNGREVVIGEFDGHGRSHFDAVYLDIVDQENIVYAYRMYVNDELLSISLVTVSFEDNGPGTKMSFTEQGVYFATQEAALSRLEGSKMLIASIAETLGE